MEDGPASQQIDAIIMKSGDWRGETLAQLRAVIKEADPAVVEEVTASHPGPASRVSVGGKHASVGS